VDFEDETKIFFAFSKVFQIVSIFLVFEKLNLVKLAYGGLVLISRQFSPLPQLSLKMILTLKVVKSGLKIILSRCYSKT